MLEGLERFIEDSAIVFHCLAVVLSYERNHSILLAIFHGWLGPFYVVYVTFFGSGEPSA
jgi:hypothetical protein